MRIEVLREAKRCPEEVAERLASAGGLNPYGLPVYRAVWGWSRLRWNCGLWTDFDASGNPIRTSLAERLAPEYEPLDRWHIEVWRPAEFYGSPEAWKQATTVVEGGREVMALGPYPSRGDWEHCIALDHKGQFIPLDAQGVEDVCRLIAFSALHTIGLENKAAIRAREEKKAKKQWQKDFDGLMEGVSPFHGQPFVSVH